mmetsp:Transcript_17146/g.36341  ORF Transcript_17146/g.36341 Transcript_17146/m.36341 type:complete len:230 (+) Transcript_17146:453-1142(+)
MSVLDSSSKRFTAALASSTRASLREASREASRKARSACASASSAVASRCRCSCSTRAKSAAKPSRRSRRAFTEPTSPLLRRPASSALRDAKSSAAATVSPMSSRNFRAVAMALWYSLSPAVRRALACFAFCSASGILRSMNSCDCFWSSSKVSLKTSCPRWSMLRFTSCWSCPIRPMRLLNSATRTPRLSYCPTSSSMRCIASFDAATCSPRPSNSAAISLACLSRSSR